MHVVIPCFHCALDKRLVQRTAKNQCVRVHVVILGFTCLITDAYLGQLGPRPTTPRRRPHACPCGHATRFRDARGASCLGERRRQATSARSHPRHPRAVLCHCEFGGLLSLCPRRRRRSCALDIKDCHSVPTALCRPGRGRLVRPGPRARTPGHEYGHTDARRGQSTGAPRNRAVHLELAPCAILVAGAGHCNLSAGREHARHHKRAPTCTGPRPRNTGISDGGCDGGAMPPHFGRDARQLHKRHGPQRHRGLLFVLPA